ncbi:hypothetical protein [Paraburkholderia sp. MM5384-R2]|uniref:hypothetical protein n=1 Tax=Paraburkholderia sp. MM5384-R2 TaxID=2723097 RepID=UPI00162107B1|nr:hypothetical protein [Paraburkholderia sp. MM5384-R2]MBB5501566.1 outer membrane protein assembly factor BamE (lipoprotein component of BamABCDE complex) [Paraburkholderia sp. MM5384-R2]
MKRIAVTVLATLCLAGLAGCGSSKSHSVKSYSSMYVDGWTKETMDRRYPNGTTQRQVVGRLGYPYQATTTGGVERWDYVGGKASTQKVSFLFRDSKVIDKAYENF